MTTLAITRRNANPYLPVASDETTMHSEIKTVVNGSLDDINFGGSTGAAIPVSSVAGNTARKGKVLALRTYSIASGTGLEINTNNLRFTYDDTLGKWVSEIECSFHQHSQLAPVVAQGYGDLPWNAQLNSFWLPYTGTMYNQQGCVPQVWMGAVMNGGTTGTIKARIRAAEHTASGGFTVNIFQSNELSFTGATDTYKILDWHTMNVINTPNANLQTGATFVVDLNVSNDSGSPHINSFTGYVRWVST